MTIIFGFVQDLYQYLITMKQKHWLHMLEILLEGSSLKLFSSEKKWIKKLLEFKYYQNNC